jgi:hypothetical protein
MATWTIQVSAQTDAAFDASGTHATTLGEAQPGDFDGATINSVSVSGTPATTVTVSDNDTLGVQFIIETSTGTDIYGTAGGADSATMCAAAESTSGSTITDGASTSPAPTTAVAADWDNVLWAVQYTQVQMADATRTISWSQFNIVVDYTAAGDPPLVIDDGLDPDALVTTGNAPFLSVPVTIFAGAPDALVTTGNVPTVLHNSLRKPQHAALEIFFGVGLLFTSDEPIITVTSGGDLVIDDGLTPDALVTTGNAPTLDVPVTIFAGAPDALEFSSDAVDAITPVVINAGAVDELAFSSDVVTLDFTWNVFPGKDTLAFGGDIPDAIVTEGINKNPDTKALTISSDVVSLDFTWNVFPGTDALVITPSAPSIQPLEKPGTGSLAFGGDAPTVILPRFIQAGAPDALSVAGKQPSALLPTIISAGSPDALSLDGKVPVTSLIVGSPTITPTTGTMTFTGQSGIETPIANSGVWIGNVNATTDVPSNYEQCDYSGFRQLPGSLKMTWNKRAVRKKSYEERHPQDYLKYKSSDFRNKGPKRPEQDDRFIEDIGEVTPDDL